MMRAPIAVTPRDMYRDESLQRILEGLKCAASCAKELNALDPKQGWGKVSEHLYAMVAGCHKLSRTRGLTRQDLLSRTERIRTTQDPMVQQR